MCVFLSLSLSLTLCLLSVVCLSLTAADVGTGTCGSCMLLQPPSSIFQTTNDNGQQDSSTPAVMKLQLSPNVLTAVAARLAGAGPGPGKRRRAGASSAASGGGGGGGSGGAKTPLQEAVYVALRRFDGSELLMFSEEHGCMMGLRVPQRTFKFDLSLADGVLTVRIARKELPVSKSFGGCPFVFVCTLKGAKDTEVVVTKPFKINSKQPKVARKVAKKPRPPPPCRPFCAPASGPELYLNTVLQPSATVAPIAPSTGSTAATAPTAATGAASSAVHGVPCISPAAKSALVLDWTTPDALDKAVELFAAHVPVPAAVDREQGEGREPEDDTEHSSSKVDLEDEYLRCHGGGGAGDDAAADEDDGLLEVPLPAALRMYASGAPALSSSTSASGTGAGVRVDARKSAAPPRPNATDQELLAFLASLPTPLDVASLCDA